MTNSMIEKATKAAQNAVTGYMHEATAFTIVRAVLTAIREPNEAMAEATKWLGGISDDGGSERGSFEDEWQAAIDSILEGG